jgi:hypothetical protein
MDPAHCREPPASGMLCLGRPSAANLEQGAIMSTWYGRPKRPGGVTFVALITFLIAFLAMAAGFVFLFSSAAALANADITEGTATSYGIAEIIFGIITALVAVGLWVGNSFARLAVTALMVVRIIAAVWVALSFSGHGGFLVGTLAGGLAVIVLLLLWNYRADEFFNAS